MSEFEVGDTVRVRTDLHDEGTYGRAGQVGTVVSNYLRETVAVRFSANGIPIYFLPHKLEKVEEVTTFKVGDYVEIHSSADPDRYDGRRGTITKLPIFGGDNFEIKEENGSNLYFPAMKLKKVDEVEESEVVFQVGDVVKVHNYGPFWDGAVGRITEIRADIVVITLTQDHKTPSYGSTVDGSTVDAGTGGFGFSSDQVTLAEPNTTALEEYKKKVLKVALRVKKSEEWCDEGFKEAMKELEIPWASIRDVEIGDTFKASDGRIAVLAAKNYWVVGGTIYESLDDMLDGTDTTETDWRPYE